jgi:hypothetical protein
MLLSPLGRPPEWLRGCGGGGQHWRKPNENENTDARCRSRCLQRHAHPSARINFRLRINQRGSIRTPPMAGGRGFGRNGTVVSLESSPYGPVLVVGGAGAGYDPSSPNADPQGYLYPAGSSL